MFYETYIKLCLEAKEKPYSVAKQLGFGNSTVDMWKNGSIPRKKSLEKIANYFNVSVNYLLTGNETHTSSLPGIYSPKWKDPTMQELLFELESASLDDCEKILGIIKVIKTKKRSPEKVEAAKVETKEETPKYEAGTLVQAGIYRCVGCERNYKVIELEGEELPNCSYCGEIFWERIKL